MSAQDGIGIGQELLNVPFAQMVQAMGVGIAEAQFELDMVGMRLAQMMSGEYEESVRDSSGNMTLVKRSSLVTFNGEKLSLLELGFTPSFYQFVDTIIEVKMSISMKSSTESNQSYSNTSVEAEARYNPWKGKASFSASVSSVSASYASKYQYSAEGSSLLRTTLVPVPPPAVLEERIRQIMETKKAKAAETAKK